MTKLTLSADLGQSIDPTAIAVLESFTIYDVVDELEKTPGAKPPEGVFYGPLQKDRSRGLVDADENPLDGDRIVRIDVRHLERLPLRMPYTAQVEIIAGLHRKAPLNGWADFVVDSTGVGRPVVDMFRRAGMRTTAVTITAGDTESRIDTDNYRVSKLLLVSRLQALLHAGELRIASKLKEARTLALELQDFRATYSENTGYARFGAREGQHDDLVLAVAIGAWWATRKKVTVRYLSLGGF